MTRALTPQQVKAIQLVSRGLANKQIAHEMNVSVSCVRHYVREAMLKLGAQNRVEAAVSFVLLMQQKS